MARAYTHFEWNEVHETALRQLVASGCTAKECARALNVTFWSVVNKARDMGLKFEGNRSRWAETHGART